jgi:hypothetical protein
MEGEGLKRTLYTTTITILGRLKVKRSSMGASVHLALTVRALMMTGIHLKERKKFSETKKNKSWEEEVGRGGRREGGRGLCQSALLLSAAATATQMGNGCLLCMTHMSGLTATPVTYVPRMSVYHIVLLGRVI